MSFLSTLIGLLVTHAYAANVDSLGSGGAGVDGMWQKIRGTLYTQQDPVTALSSAIITFLLSIIGGVAVLLVIYASIKIVTGQGKDESISEAKDIIYYALLGIVLAILAAAIVGFFGGVFFPTLFQ